jgi:hypothetical protein
MLYSVNVTEAYRILPMSDRERLYAVAVCDGELYLFLRVRRNLKGEVFVMIPMESEEGRKLWNPHASYHTSGQRHDKSYGRAFPVRQQQKPDSTLQGEEYVLARPIAAREPRAFNIRCQVEQFAEVFEIPVQELGTETYRTAIAVDLAEPQDLPIKPVNAMDKTQIIRQKIFDDVVPWIVVTLYDMQLA